MSQIRQLIDYFIPENYQLYLEISKSKRHYSGTVTMTGQPLADKVYLHAKDLTINNVIADGKDTGWNLADDELTIFARAETITVDFSGQISDTSMNGLYICKYQANGEPCELFATQFESHYARECFPCIDEPDAKATFNVAIKTTDPDDKVVLSNMPGQLIDGIWQFDITPPMSTYLLAFVGGDLISKTGQTKRGTTVSTYATPAQSPDLLDFPLETVLKSIEFYEDYFNINYPLPKLDNVALPDFSAGAMENWGLITYREILMLADNHTAEASREQIVTVIAHEIAHQWFGNLVTMKWWDGLWLNESFASLMENIATDNFHPEYQIWDSFNNGDVPFALQRDALTGIQSVQQEVNTPDEIATLFDGAIVYTKGERLLKMLLNLIGVEAFQQALTSYFTKHQYGNTVADDLWAELSAASNIDTKALIEPWLTRPGYPIVRVSLNGDQLTLTQERFLMDGSIDNSLWPIPLFSNVSGLPQIMTDRQVTTTINPEQLAHLNIGNHSHFITQYDDSLLAKLVDNFNNLDIADRIKLLRESVLLSQAGRQDISQSFQLLQKLSTETNSDVLAAGSAIVNQLKRLIDPDSDMDRKLKVIVRNIFANNYRRLFTSDTQLDINDTKSLEIVLAANIYGENPDAIDYCQKIFADHRHNLAELPSDMRVNILAANVKFGDQTVWDNLWQAYQQTQDGELKADIGSALTDSKDLTNAKTLLTAILDNAIRPQDVLYFVAWLMVDRRTLPLTWNWLRQHWDWITKVFGGDMGYNDFVCIASQRLYTPDQLTEYDEFCATITNPALARTIQMGRTDIINRIQWISVNKPVIEKLLVD
ncbi:MAG: M1 family metallopeptidase [Candidatus Saccharibacteria bacterium]|nr:M1 family metallopeptidase [Candidatus Saccharibacteria bacterium]